MSKGCLLLCYAIFVVEITSECMNLQYKMHASVSSMSDAVMYLYLKQVSMVTADLTVVLIPYDLLVQ